MPEELSPESKLYIKEEIEKVRKEFKDDLKDAQSKSTKIFSTVAMIIGLVTGIGVYLGISNAIKGRLDDAGITKLVYEANKLVESAEDANDAIQDIKISVEKDIPMLKEMKSFDQKEVQDGYAWVGNIALIWGTRTSTKDTAEVFPIGWDCFKNDCFTVLTSLAGEVVILKDNKNFRFDRVDGYSGSHKFTFLALGH